MNYFSGVFLFFLYVCYVGAASISTYSNRYDKIDLQAVIRNDRLLRNYVDCLLDKVNCRPDGLELKKALPDALKNECSRCTEAQKKGTTLMLRHLILNRRQWWNELEAKYDPKRIYITRYSAQLKKAGVVL
ncbi:hypothetical protein WA026_018999 [Henosepilachna vigintioctopunctata]|uniref:Uncharacterized protein n=1 Tax=Henosepilachna vigintioctopunctata TaxID=420089 RepID=A0AAW1VFF7_9CUCU